MTVNDVIKKLRNEQEQNLGSRFCCRAIMVDNISQYINLMDSLRMLSHVEMVSPSDLFDGDDILPRYENLTSSAYYNKWLILPGVSEYLRLFGSDEGESRRFDKLWNCREWPATNTGRILIPLWGCKGEWHDKSLHFMGNIRQNDFFFDCTEDNCSEENLDLMILSGKFRQYKDRLAANYQIVMDGVKEWYEYWSNPSPQSRSQLFITDRINSVRQVNGDISVHVIRDAFSFVQANMGGANALTSKICPPEATNYLFEKSLHGDTADEAILSCLNTQNFSGIDIMSKWGNFDIGKKQLVKLWYQLHPDDTYLHFVIMASENISDVEEYILHQIFICAQKRPDWVHESQELIEAMHLTRDEDYIDAVKQIPDYEGQLKYLSGNSEQEKCFLLNLVGNQMRKSADDTWRDQIKSVYPALYAYLDEAGYDEELKRYMKLYKAHKLANTLPKDEHTYFANIGIEDYVYRYSAISDALNDQTIVLWIDALGVEWLPLTLWALGQVDSGKIESITVTQANLPTETKFNKQWEQMNVPYEKELNGLDKLAHNGVIDNPNYYACIEKQIEFVASTISGRVRALLKKYHRVIITGDHGTSRLAARFFHKRDGVTEANAQALSHGRYGLVASTANMQPTDKQMLTQDDTGKKYIVFKNYDHFKIPGRAAGASDDNPEFGEIHGGATPEEILVPVIVVDSKDTQTLSATWKNNPIKISMRKAKGTICFNGNVSSLQAKIGANIALTNKLTPKEWTVEFSNLKSGTHQVLLIANGNLVHIAALTVKSALVSSDGDLP